MENKDGCGFDFHLGELIILINKPRSGNKTSDSVVSMIWRKVAKMS